MLLFITRGGMNKDTEVLAKEVSKWTDNNLDADYPWPGNFRELEQCVRNIIGRNIALTVRRPPALEKSMLNRKSPAHLPPKSY